MGSEFRVQDSKFGVSALRLVVLEMEGLEFCLWVGRKKFGFETSSILP